MLLVDVEGAVTGQVTSDRMDLKVAGLGLRLDGRGSGLRLAAPPCHASFLVGDPAGDSLNLRLRDGSLLGTDGWQSLFFDRQTWRLWRDGDGRYIFVAPRHSPPPRQVAVDAAFHTGDLIGEFHSSKAAARAIYPLQDLDKVLYANWLAETGDLIVHACGIATEGAGYAFIGPSGAGKSTLATVLASAPSVTVLGEDSVILRREEDRFLLYGTPWHTNLERCSPGGVPLEKLFFLKRAVGRGAEPLGRRAGIERVLQDAYIPYYNRPGVERILDGLSRLAEQVPFYDFDYQLGTDVLGLIRDA